MNAKHLRVYGLGLAYRTGGSCQAHIQEELVL